MKTGACLLGCEIYFCNESIYQATLCLCPRTSLLLCLFLSKEVNISWNNLWTWGQELINKYNFFFFLSRFLMRFLIWLPEIKYFVSIVVANLITNCLPHASLLVSGIIVSDKQFIHHPLSQALFSEKNRVRQYLRSLPTLAIY